MDEIEKAEGQTPTEPAAAPEQPAPADAPADAAPATDASEQPEQPAPADVNVVEKLPPPELRPTILVQFTGPDSAMFDVKFMNFNPLAIIYQHATFAKWLEERCSFFLQYGFERQFAQDMAQRQMQQEAVKGAPRKPGLVVPPPGMRIPQQRPK